MGARYDLPALIESEGVRAHAVEEPAVVRDDERAAREVLQRLF